MYDRIAGELAADRTVILDGGTGTDLQRRGVSMDGEAWCAMANLTDGEAVRAVHSDYVRAGAHVITANTYASSPVSFLARGREGEIEEIDRKAVAHARRAIEESAEGPVALAGSISVMPSIPRGTDRSEVHDWKDSEIRPLYRRKAQVLAEAGCDLLLMEMMRDLDVSVWATEEAVATGLPVWVGISVERSDSGELVSHGGRGCALDAMTRALMRGGARAALVMHNEITTTDEALATIRTCWDGPVGAYPESGHFAMPDWVFREIEPDAFVEACERWHGQGARILGGCCGITPEHIAALAARFAEA